MWTEVRPASFLIAWLACFVPAQAAPQVAVTPITGRVVDEDGKPIAGAAVGAFTAYDFVDTAQLLKEPQVTTAADGTYRILVAGESGHVMLVLAAAGRQSCVLQIDDERATLGGAVGDTLLMPGARLMGRVRGADGAPLGGVRIRVEAGIDDPYDVKVRLLAGAVSDDQGIFSVPCVPRTGMRLCADADGYLQETMLVAQESPIDLSLKPVGMVRGKVVDAGGAAVAGIQVHGVTGEARDRFQSVLSAADGSFAVTVPSPGRFRIAGHELQPPYRQFSSGLLHGAGDGVVVRLLEPDVVSARTLEVTVVDAATKAPIPEFQLAEVQGDPSNLQAVMFESGRALRAQQTKAEVKLTESLEGILVAAAGHGFEVVPVSADERGPLRVELGPEAVLIGSVTDAETGKPMPGVAVQALPKGDCSGGFGRAEDAGPLSDAQGNYRIPGLRPGEYGVQAHAAGRAASPVSNVSLRSGADNKLDLGVPKSRWLDFELTGSLPVGPGCQLRIGGAMFHGSSKTGYSHYVPLPPPLPLARTGAYRLGPVGSGAFELQLFVPSRTRIGTGTTLRLGEIDPDRGGKKIALPDLTCRILRGRVELPHGVPSERIGVLAVRTGAGQSLWFDRPTVDGVDSDGRFAMDLPVGSYTLQLVDLSTSIVFHTEAQDLELGPQPAAITLRPQIHWLEIDCVPRREGDEVVLQSFLVGLPRSRDGTCHPFLQGWGGGNNVENCSVDFQRGGSRQHWLVPAGVIEVQALQSFEVLQPWVRGNTATVVDSAKLQITGPEQRVTMKIPAPPTDAELRRRD